MRSLICGAYDLHVHSAPDLIRRGVDDMELAGRISACGMAGFAIKSHFFCTAQRAELVRQANPSCDAIGTLTLNNAVGGINPIAVEMAARAGARLIWFPTCDAQWERDYAEAESGKKAFWAEIVEEMHRANIRLPGIRLLGEDGKLRGCVHEVLEVIAKHRIALCTGHISHAETFALLRAAHEQGVERMIVTHVTFPSTRYTLEEQREMARLGAYMEHCYCTYATGKAEFADVARQIRELGPEHVILSTDLGQPARAYPDEGMLHFAADLYENGFTEREIAQMVRENCRRLIQA